ncbi:BadF/BadG/BcrA/BcrD ATPase family protein [Tabrizicola soli]|uniref:BadF/BadG/BcrA/BcrD ATPase family protein n=1 Tax=Tabrizicola soli TaxID=2185115 RepID=A0ABV7E278_9RHOB|nr:BadF/BadG/BcrA/BcrD ATPase family protein [Tabrizicola soli]
MGFFLGIDGGGTGCRAAVADASGRVLGEGVAGPANIASDLAGARDNILAATTEALTRALGVGAVAAELPALSAGLGLAGANAAGRAEALRRALPFARIKLETDAIAAVKGALADRDGIVAALGTGSVFAAQAGGRIRQVGGWGLVLGDEGSGAWLGREVLRQALLAADGFRAGTPLLDAVLKSHGGTEGVIAFSLAARPADFARLAPEVLAADDPIAHELVAIATADVARAVHVLQRDPPLPVTFIGGLGPSYAARLGNRWAIRPAQGSALDGALILAREAA